MSRKAKATVEYFSHKCKHGRVLFVLESLWGNNGYAFFYKLYELLGDSEGHIFDLNISGNWDYLLAHTHTTRDIADMMLLKLSELCIIDKDLIVNGVVWSQCFVDDLEDVYSRRTINKPVKPIIMSTEIQLNEQDVDIYPQSKVKESKVKETKGKEISLPPKTKHLDSVYLTESEYKKLKEVLSQKSLDIGIEKLDYSITVKGGKYKDHYKTLLNWFRRGYLTDGSQGSEKKYAGIKEWLSERDDHAEGRG